MFSSSQIFICCLLTLSAMSCETAQTPSVTRAINEMNVIDSITRMPNYDFETPDKVFKMPSSLDEISGLSYDQSTNMLWAVQDEEGQLFEISTKTGEIESVQTFWKDGDYEGVEVVGGWVYMTKNTGTLYAFDGDTTMKFNGFIDGSYDIEGLGYLASKNQLLLSCKATPWKNSQDRPIYVFDIEGKVFLDKPYLIIKQDAIRDQILKNQNEEAEDFKKFLEKKKYFSPSAIAQHPVTKSLYILSHQGKMLLVLGENGTVHHVYKLNKKVFEQPEGLTFSNDGTLYISSEKSKADKAKVFVFKQK